MNSSTYCHDTIVQARFQAAEFLRLSTLLSQHTWTAERPDYAEKPAGLYLTLYHGRLYPEAPMNDWGFNGPSIGPLDWLHITYLNSINLGFSSGEETGPLFCDAPLHFDSDMLFYAGCWYGDWELQWQGDRNGELNIATN